MKKLFSILVFLFISVDLSAQTEILVPYRKGDLWGFADSNMMIKIIPQYNSADQFHEDWAIVTTDQGCNYVNTKGELLSDNFFTMCFEFRNGFARIDKGNSYAVINKTGRVITPFKYSVYSHRKPSISDYEPFLMDSLVGVVLLNDSEILIDTSGKELTGDEYRSIFIFEDHGLAGVSLKKSDHHRSGLINKKGKLVVPFIYDDLDVFAYVNFIYASRNGKFGYIDPKGNVVIDFKFDGAEPFRDGKAIVKSNDHYGIIDTTGEFILKPEYEYISDEYNDYFLLRNGNSYSILNPQLKIDFKYHIKYESWTLHRIASSGYYYVFAHNKIFFLDSLGNETGQEFGFPTREELDSAGYNSFGCSFCKEVEFDYHLGYDDMYFSYENKKIAIVNDRGKLLTPYKYDQVDFYWGDMGRVRIGKEYGYVDKAGKEIALGFESVSPFYNEFARVSKDGKYGYINRKGELVIPCIYEDADYWFEDGIIKIKFNGKDGYIDTQGRQFFE